MADDIVTRLRNHAEDEAMLGNDWLRDIMRDGADEIERLRKLMSDYVSLWYQTQTTTNGAPNDLIKAYYAAFHAMAKGACRD